MFLNWQLWLQIALPDKPDYPITKIVLFPTWTGVGISRCGVMERWLNDEQVSIITEKKFSSRKVCEQSLVRYPHDFHITN